MWRYRELMPVFDDEVPVTLGEGFTPLLHANPATVADGLRVPRAIGDFLILRAVRESGGTAIAAVDTAMIEGMLELGSAEGISAAPEGGTALAAIRQLVSDRLIRSRDRVVLFNTGGALKYLDALPDQSEPLPLISRQSP